jgi:hypothetical protein
MNPVQKDRQAYDNTMAMKNVYNFAKHFIELM